MNTQKIVTDNILHMAIRKAITHFRIFHDEYKRVFRQHVSRRMRVKPHAVSFSPLKNSERRIRSSKLQACDDCYGWTDGLQIFISSAMPMAFDELVGTLIHEELHCFCKVHGQYLPTKREHYCMKVLGDAV